MVQETFLVAREVLRKLKHSPSESVNTQFLSENALIACSRVSKGLAPIEFSPEEEEILNGVKDISTLQSFIDSYISEVDKKSKHTKAWKKVQSFSAFAEPVLDIFKEASFSPECTIALGLVGVLLIQPLNRMSEIEERLNDEISKLKDIISQVDFSRHMVPTQEMEIEIQGLSAAIIDFLLHALQYQKKWGIVKVLGCLLSDFAKRFQAMVEKIRRHSDRIEELAKRGYSAAIMSSKDVVDRTEQKLLDLDKKFVTETHRLELQIGRMNTSIAHCIQAIEESSKIQAIEYIQRVTKALSPRIYDIETQQDIIREQESMLAPKEQWQNHSSQIQFPGWLNLNSRPILWIGGKENRRGFSWVSSFSLDLIEALEIEPSATIAYVLCESNRDLHEDEEEKESKYTPLNIFKNILIQLLNIHPEMLYKPANFSALPFSVFEYAGSSTEIGPTFRLLGKFLKMVDEKLCKDSRELFILIDRVDLVLDVLDDKGRFLDALQTLNEACDRLRIVLTSGEEAPEERVGEHMKEVWVDTRRILPMEMIYD